MTKQSPSNTDLGSSKGFSQQSTTQTQTDKPLDTGLACLVMAARFHQVAADPSQIKHNFGSYDLPLDEVALIRAARHLKLKAKAVKASIHRLESIALPAIDQYKDDSYFVLARAGEGKVLIQDPLVGKPEVLTEAEFLTKWNGRLLLITKRSVLPGMTGKFDISWFIPAIIKYKKILTQVLIASFFIQLFALATPLFFQVIIDKVLVHQGLTTLDVLCVWSYFGKIDIVAVATGKVIPSEYIKHIQPLEAGKIKSIHIKEGQYVQKGDALITLDTTNTQADVERLTHEIHERQNNIERFIAFEYWLSNQTRGATVGVRSNSLFVGSDTLTEMPVTEFPQQNILSQQKAELTARLNSLNREHRKQLAEQAMVQGEITKKKRIHPVLKERVDALETLLKKDYGSKLQFLELKQELIEEEQDLIIQTARYQQLDASLDSIQNQIDSLISEARLNNLNQLQESQLQLSGLQQESIKAKERNQQQLLTAPINGQVQQLAVHTIGGVVTPAQALMVIVPQDSQMEVEAMILNKDIGFVQEGQKAEVKIDTFNFTKYGLIDAESSRISDDAIQDENLGLVYSARFKLNTEELQVEDRMVRLSPGMSVTAEVKTGKRRLIEYFLSPLLRYKQESLGER